MSRRQVALLVLLAAVAVFVGWLAWRSREPPRLPDDDTHRAFVSGRACLECHGPDGAVPQGPNHPPAEEDCLRCHASAR